MTKKRVIGITAFFLVFSVLFVMASYLLRLEDVSTKERFAGFYAEQDNTLDTVFIGSSAAYVFVVAPEIWKNSGVASYVLGAPALPFDTVPYLMEEAEKSQDPNLYVIEIRSLISHDVCLKNKVQDDRETFLRNLTDSMPYSLNRTRLINATVTGESKLNWYFDLFNNHSNWKLVDPEAFSLMFYNKKSDVKSAYTFGAWQKQTAFDTAPYAGEKLPLEESSEETLKTVLDSCKSQNRNVLFLSTPYVESKTSIALENYAADLIRSYGYSYLNCNYAYSDIGLDFSGDFYNSNHVNVVGSTKVTDYLLSYITSHYDVKSGRSAPAAAEWDAAYETWSALAQEQTAAVQAKIREAG